MNNFEIIGLVDYSSDESLGAEEIIDEPNKTLQNDTPKLKEDSTSDIKQDECDILSIPAEIKCMFADTSQNVTDDVEKHGGKIRSFPHERGVWASYVYIEYNPKPYFLQMIEHLKQLCEKHNINLNSFEDFHVSLSKTLKLRHHWIKLFIDSLRAHLKHFIKFKIMFQSLEVYENEEKTRTFLGLKVHFGFDYLCKITEKVDFCLSEFKLPLFYKNPSFHLSCAACVGSKSEQIELFMADLNAVCHSFMEIHSACRTLWVTDIHCKIGNKFFKIPLKG